MGDRFSSVFFGKLLKNMDKSDVFRADTAGLGSKGLSVKSPFASNEFKILRNVLNAFLFPLLRGITGWIQDAGV